LSPRLPRRFAGRLAEGQKAKPEHRVVIEEAFTRRFALEKMVAEAAGALVEGMVPKELAGAGRGGDPVRLVKGFAGARKPRSPTP